MTKNKEMLKLFFKILINKPEAINLVIPRSYQKNIFEIDYQSLKKAGYHNLIFDIDNTIMPVNSIDVSLKLQRFMNEIKKDFNICLVSNNSHDRVYPVSEKLNLLSLSNAHKPTPEAFKQSLILLKGTPENTIMIGDQMLSDIVGGNQNGLYTILVEPYQKKYDLKTGINRILQNIIMHKIKKYIKRYNYY